jgi:cold shock CspA family protein
VNSSGGGVSLRRRGVVAAFDASVGLGTVAPTGDDGGFGQRELPFHCTRIADGSRTIDVGAPVTFSVVPGRGGRWEAADLRIER